MTASRRDLAALVLAASLAGCGGRIWSDQESPQGIRVHWYTREASIDRATRRAERHCETWGKHAFLAEEFVDHDVTVAGFECR